jgi:hypothetical protein
MLTAAADVVVVVIVVAAVTFVIVPVAIIALAFVLRCPLFLSLCRLLFACCLPLLMASLRRIPL